MAAALLTMDDFDLGGKRVLLRADMNSPLDPRSGEILDTSRIAGYLPTLKRLSGSKVAILTHQSRPGKNDFTTTKRHAEVLGRMLKKKVGYVDDVFGSCAKKEIQRLEGGDVLILENVRFCSEEMSKDIAAKPPLEQARTHMVRKLSGYVDFFVNDAFAVSHRSQPSVVAFPMVLPSCVGPFMDQEIKVLSEVLRSQEKPKVFSLGGAKADDSFMITRNVLKKGVADKVLLSGVAALIFLIAQGVDVGSENRKLVKTLRYEGLIQEAGALLKSSGDRIKLPQDLAFEKNGKRSEADVEGFPDKKALDIGEKTIEAFSDEVGRARVVIAKGPTGVFEVNGFDKGTRKLLEAIGDSKALSVIGGGHLTTVAENAGLKSRITHIGSGGGATVSFLSDQPLPGIEALKRAAGGKR